MTLSTPRRRAWRSLPLALAVAGLVGACGTTGGTSTSDDASSTSVAAEAKAAVEEASAPVDAWPGPDDPVDAPSDKKITILTCGSTGITCVRVANGAKAAAQALGWEADVVDGQNQPTVWNGALKTALAEGTDAIVLAAVPPAAVAGALEQAKQQDVPVIGLLSSAGEELATDTITLDSPAIGKLFADVIAVESGGDGKVLLLQDQQFPEIQPRWDALKKELAAVCEKCSVDSEQEFSLALASQRLAGIVSSTLSSKPSIDFVIQPFDAITPFTEQGLRAGGSSAKIIGLGADPPSIQAIGNGTEVASIGTPAEWMGWMAIDSLLRNEAGQDVPDYTVPSRVLTEETVPGEDGWQGDFDYQAKFKQLWGR
jgi:ribose transport system substrate-binding protein